jgi:hypothetical protein
MRTRLPRLPLLPSMSPRTAAALLAVAIAAAAAIALLRTLAAPVGPVPERPALGAAGASAPPAATPVTTPGGAAPIVDAPEAQGAEVARVAVAVPVPERDALSIAVVDPDGRPVEGAEVVVAVGGREARAVTSAAGGCVLPIGGRAAEAHVRVESAGDHVRMRVRDRWQQTVTLPRSGPVHGRLVDRASGAPIAGASVSRPHDRCFGCEPDRAVTDANGAFTLPHVARDEDCRFVFAHPDHPRLTVELRLAGRGEPLAHTFAIDRGVVLAGLCVDATTRRPIAAAQVLHRGEPVATTAVDGTFRVVVDVGRAAATQLAFHADGYCKPTWRVAVPQRDAAATFGLDRGTVLTGRVVTSAGAPIPQATVRAARVVAVIPTSATGLVGVEEVRMPRVFADERGEFRMEGLVRDGTYELRARHFEWGALDGDPVAVVRAADGAPPVTLVLAARRSGTVTGTFRCNGEPGPGEIQWRHAGRSGSKQIAKDGGFRLTLPAGRVQLVATAARHAGSFAALQWRRELDVPPDREVHVDVDHRADDAAISGRVVRADRGAPAFAMLTARHGDEWTATVVRADGSFSVLVPRSVESVQLEVEGLEWPLPPRTARPGEHGIELVVPQRGELRFRVRDADGVLVAMPFARFADVLHSSHHHPISAPDPNGFRTYALPRGTRTFVLGCAGHVPCVRTLDVGASTTLDETLSRGTDATVRLHRDAAVPEPGWRVQWLDASLAGLTAAERADVWFDERRELVPCHDGAVLRGIGPGTHRLVATDPSIEIVPAEVVAGTEPVTVELRWRRRPQ